MKKQLCKTFRTMAAKLKDGKYGANVYELHGKYKVKQGIQSVHPVNHYRRLKRIFTRDGVKGVEIYYKKHVA